MVQLNVHVLPCIGWGKGQVRISKGLTVRHREHTWVLVIITVFTMGIGNIHGILLVMGVGTPGPITGIVITVLGNRTGRRIVPRNWESMRIPALVRVGAGLDLHGIEEVIEYIIIPNLLVVNTASNRRRAGKPCLGNVLLVGRSRNCGLANTKVLTCAWAAAQATT